MRKTLCTVVVSGVLLAAFSAYAQPLSGQDVSGAPTPASIEPLPTDQQPTEMQIRKYFEVVRERRKLQQLSASMPTHIQQNFEALVRSISAKLPPGRRLTPEDRAALDKLMRKYMQKGSDVYPIDEMIADVIPLYQRHLTRSDVDALITFYSSPPGQHLLNAEPEIMSEFGAIETPLILFRSRQMDEEMSEEIQKLLKPELNPPAPASN